MIRLASFFKGLYSHMDVAALKKVRRDRRSLPHLCADQQGRKCPFCGINDLLGEHHSRREAYDHYLPKALYPFNSINFRNLVPACHHCNSSYKTSKDPAYTPKDPARAVHRRAIFYPYKAAAHSIELQIDLQHSDIAKLTPEDITFQFGPQALVEKLTPGRMFTELKSVTSPKFAERMTASTGLRRCSTNGKKVAEIQLIFVDVGAASQEISICRMQFSEKPFLEACQKIGAL